MSKRGDAWRTIGNKLLNEGRIEDGLCAEIGLLDYPGKAELASQLLAHRQDWSHAGHDHSDVYLYQTRMAGSVGCGEFHEERAMGCYWMALEADEEDARFQRDTDAWLLWLLDLDDET